MRPEWFTLEQAAKHLGVSSRTLRRWIHAGKLQAELRPGPYGQQYVVPGEQLGAVALIRDVDRVERRREEESLPRMVEDHLQQREQALIVAMEALRTEIQRATERITAGQEAILEELRELRRVLEDTQRERDDAGNA